MPKSSSSSDDDEDSFEGLTDLNISNDQYYQPKLIFRPGELINKRSSIVCDTESAVVPIATASPSSENPQLLPTSVKLAQSSTKKATGHPEPFIPPTLSSRSPPPKRIPPDTADVDSIIRDIPQYGSPEIRHSLPAYDLWRPFYPTFLTDEKCRDFHRPKLKHYNLGPQVCFNQPRKSRYFPIKSLAINLYRHNQLLQNSIKEAISQGYNRQQIINKFLLIYKAKDLTAKCGRLVLFEYSEEHPTVLGCIGMASIIKNYSSDSKKLRGPKQVYFSDPKPGSSYQMIENNLYRAPIYQHQAPHSDFLIIRTRNSFYIRLIGPVYTVGQTLPLVAVPPPTATAIQRFRTLLSNAHVEKLFMDNIFCPPAIPLSTLSKLFPDYSLETLRCRLAKAGAEYKKDEKVFLKGSSNYGLMPLRDLRKYFTPEQYCLNMATLAARERLRNLNYTETMIDPPDGAVIEPEVLAAPWNTSKATLEAIKGKHYLDFKKHLIDPTGPQREGFSCVAWAKSPSEDQFKSKEANHAEQEFNLANKTAIMNKIKREKLERLAIYRNEARIIAEVQNSALSTHEVLSSEEDGPDENLDDEGDSEMLDGSFDEQLRDLGELVLEGRSAQELSFEKEEVERRSLIRELNIGSSQNHRLGVGGNPRLKNQGSKASVNYSNFKGKLLKITRTYESPDGCIQRTEIVKDARTIALYVQLKGSQGCDAIPELQRQSDETNGSSSVKKKLLSRVLNNTFCASQKDNIQPIRIRARSNSLDEGELCRAEGMVLRISKSVLSARALRKQQRQTRAKCE